MCTKFVSCPSPFPSPKNSFCCFQTTSFRSSAVSSIERGCYLEISARGISPLVHPSPSRPQQYPTATQYCSSSTCSSVLSIGQHCPSAHQHCPSASAPHWANREELILGADLFKAALFSFSRRHSHRRIIWEEEAPPSLNLAGAYFSGFEPIFRFLVNIMFSLLYMFFTSVEIFFRPVWPLILSPSTLLLFFSELLYSPGQCCFIDIQPIFWGCVANQARFPAYSHHVIPKHPE